MVTSPVVEVVTDSVKTTVKLIGLVPVGSACPAAWLIVTVGAVMSPGDGVVGGGRGGVAVAGRVGGDAGGDRGDDRAAGGHPGDGDVVGGARTGDGGGQVPPAVPVMVTSPVAKSSTASLKTTVKLIGGSVGSACPAAWLIVTVGGVASASSPTA